MSNRKAETLADPGFYYLGVVVDTEGNIQGDDLSAVYIDSTLKSKYSRTIWDTSKWNTLLWNCSVQRKKVGLRKASPQKLFEECWIQFNTINELNAYAGTNFTQAPNEGK